MVHPSKIFFEPLNCYHCSQFILHPDIGCFKFFVQNLYSHGLSGLKYFTPILITPIVLKYKHMNRKLFYQSLKHYLQTVFWSTLATASTFLWICCFRNLLGKFRTYTTIFLPTVLGLQFSWFFPPRVTTLFTTATTQATLEGLFLQHSNKLTHLFLHSTSAQTLLFMLNSAIILHYKSKNIYKDFWFIESNKKFTKRIHDEDIQNQNEIFQEKPITHCDHGNVSCGKFVLDGVKSYVFYGIPLDVISMFMKSNLNRGPKNFMANVKGKLRTFRPLMTAFFLSYVGIYRLSSCFLRKYFCHLSLDIQHALSAFLGGLSFIFIKNRNSILLSLVISAQLLYQQFCSSLQQDTAKTGRKQNLMLMLLNNFPVSKVLLSINCGYLAHNYLFNHHLINSLARGFLDALTNKKLKNILNYVSSNDVQTLNEMGKPYPIKMFL